MSDSLDLTQYSLAAPATFELQLLGYLDASWSEELEGAQIDHASLSDESPVTIVTARVIDQAALTGIVNRLYGLGFPLISIEFLHVE